MSAWPSRILSLGLGASLLLFIACGARTSLMIPDAPEEADAGVEPDAEPDVVVVADAEPDVIVIEVPDAEPDVYVKDCVEAGVTYIYTVTQSNELLRFDPPTAQFTTIGVISCPTLMATPFSMAVNRKGTAHVVFSDGNLFQVSTATGACKATDFVRDQQGFSTFGMGYSTNLGGPEETLFVAESDFEYPALGLGSIDPVTLELTFVAPFSQQPGNAIELTGTGDGRLYGLFIDQFANTASIARIDKTTGDLSEITPVPLGASTGAFAFAFWDNDFYVFHQENAADTIVSRFRPSDGSFTDVASLPTPVVGVGVSTCAPE